MSSALLFLCALGGDVYTYADEHGSQVSNDGMHVTATLAVGSEVYAGLGIGFDGAMDASAYDGIAFEARRAPGATPYVRLKLPDAATDPDGGVCTECYNDFGLSFQVTEEWVRYEVRFADLKQEDGWGNPRPPAIDAAHLYGVQFQTEVAGAELDLEVRNVALLGCEGGGGGGFTAPRGRPGFGPSEDDEESEGYRFRFHGFLRVPMRISLGNGGKHSPPHIPDEDYTDWRYTNVGGGPWTELWLKYGNGKVSANVVIAAYDITDSSYRDLLSQLGIDQSFVQIALPHLVWKIGAFTERYGTAARYDAGKYDTYLFGATHAAGESLSAWYPITDDLTLAVDHGIGAKIDVTPLVPGLEAPYLPYPGDVQQGTTLLHHAHLGVAWRGGLTGALHYLTEWNDDAALPGEYDGRVTNVGVDVKWFDSPYGDLYVGWSHLMSKRPLRLAGAFEAIHSFEGWNLRDNYFGPDAEGTGTIDTLLFQYTYAPIERLTLSAFGMYNHVASDDPLFTAPTDRFKFGGEATWAAKDWLAGDLRYDVVQPDLSDSGYSFHVISPSLVLRTALESNEEIWLGYSYYLDGEDVAPAYPNELLPPDHHLLRITAVMWW